MGNTVSLKRILCLTCCCFALTLGAKGQTKSVELKEYVEHTDFLSLGDKGIVIVLTNYDDNNVVYITSDGEVKWNVSIEGAVKGKMSNYSGTFASPNGKYVYSYYQMRPNSGWPAMELAQINEHGETRIYEYEKLRTEKKNYFKRAIASLDNPKYGFIGFYSDNDYLYSFEQKLLKKGTFLSDDVRIRMNRFTHTNLEYDSMSVVVPGLPAKDGEEFTTYPIEIIGSDKATVYLARKSINTEKTIHNYQVISVDRKMNLVDSKALQLKLSSGNTILKSKTSSKFNDTWGAAEPLKYNASDKAFYVHGATEQNTVFIQKYDLDGNLMFELEEEIKDYSFLFTNPSYNRIMQLTKTSDNTLSLSAWGTWSNSKLVQLYANDKGELLKSGLHDIDKVAFIPKRDLPLVFANDMHNSAKEFYKGLGRSEQFRRFFQYYPVDKKHYVVSFNKSEKRLNYFVIE